MKRFQVHHLNRVLDIGGDRELFFRFSVPKMPSAWGGGSAMTIFFTSHQVDIEQRLSVRVSCSAIRTDEVVAWIDLVLISHLDWAATHDSWEGSFIFLPDPYTSSIAALIGR